MKMRTMKHDTMDARPPRSTFSLTKSGVLVLLGVFALSVGLAGIVYAQGGSERSQWDQCADNDSGGQGHGLNNCTWQKANIGNNQTAYVEGTAVPIRWVTTQITNSQHIGDVWVDVYTWQFDWGTTSNHGFDWLVSWEQAQQLHQDYSGGWLNISVCGDLSNDRTAEAVCNLVTGSSGVHIEIPAPDDPYLSGICGATLATCSTQRRIDAFESSYGERTIDVYFPPTTGIITPTLELWHTMPSGSDYQTSSYVAYTMTITSTQPITSSMIAFASHLAISGDPYSNPLAWGENPVNQGGVGAAPITGASWHHLRRYVNGDGSATEMQINLWESAAAPILSSRSTGLITTSGVGVTDTITMTHDTQAQQPDITGSIRFYLCRWDTKPTSDPSTEDGTFQGCTSNGTRLEPDVTLTVLGNDTSIATSPIFTPTQTGYYCYRAAFTPSGSPLRYVPISDTNPFSMTTVVTYTAGQQSYSIGVAPECFQVQKTTAVRLSNFAATSGDGFTFAGFSVFGLIIGLLGLVASAGVGVVAWRTLKS